MSRISLEWLGGNDSFGLDELLTNEKKPSWLATHPKVQATLSWGGTILHRFIAVLVGVPYNALLSASYYMMYNMYMIDEDMRSAWNGIEAIFKPDSETRERLRNHTWKSKRKIQNDDSSESSRISRNTVFKALRLIGLVLLLPLIPVIRILAVPVFALYGAVVGGLAGLLMAVVAPETSEYYIEKLLNRFEGLESEGLSRVLQLPYQLLIKQRELRYDFFADKTLGITLPEDKEDREDFRKLTFTERWLTWGVQNRDSEDNLLVFKLPLTTRHALMLSVATGVLLAAISMILVATGGFGLVGFVAAHTGISFALTSYALVNTALAGLTVGAVGSLALSMATYLVTLVGWQIGNAIQTVAQYWRGDKVSTHWKALSNDKQKRHVNLLELLWIAVVRTGELSWQGLGIIAATVSLLFFSPMMRVLRLTADVTEFADKWANILGGSSASKDDEYLPVTHVDNDEYEKEEEEEEDENSKPFRYHAVRIGLTLAGLVYFAVMLPVAIVRGVIYAFVNGYNTGSYGLRTGVAAISLHSDLSRDATQIDPADIEQIGVKAGNHTLVMTLLFLAAVTTVLTVLAIVFFPPSAHLAINILSALGMNAASFSTPVLAVAGGSGMAASTIVLGAGAEAGMVVARGVSQWVDRKIDALDEQSHSKKSEDDEIVMKAASSEPNALDVEFGGLFTKVGSCIPTSCGGANENEDYRNFGQDL